MRIALVLVALVVTLAAGCVLGGVAVLWLFPTRLHDFAITADLRAQIEDEAVVREAVGTATDMRMSLVESHAFGDPDTWVYEMTGTDGVATIVIRSETTNAGERIDWAVIRGPGRTWIPLRGEPPYQEIEWAYGDEMSADVELELASALAALGLPTDGAVRLDVPASEAIEAVETFVFELVGAPAGTRIHVVFTPADVYEASEDAPWIESARLERADGTTVPLIGDDA
jgi:hypothetical protein